MRRCDLHCRAARWDEVRRQCAQAYPLQTLEPDTAAPAERAGAAASDAEAPMRAAGMAELGKAVHWALAALGSLKLAGKASSAMAGASVLGVALEINPARPVFVIGRQTQKKPAWSHAQQRL